MSRIACDEGIRTQKTKSGVVTNYYYNGTQLLAEETSGNVTVYLYDSSGSTFGGGVSGAVMASTKNTVAANYIGAGAESFANEVASYIPKVSEFNGETSTKSLNRANVADSLSTAFRDMLVNGSVNMATSHIAGRIIPTNNGWFAPKRFSSSFLGKYAKLAHAHTFLQGFIGVVAEDVVLK